MKSIACVALKPGMVIAEDILSYKNELLIPAHTEIDERILQKLNAYSIMCVSIKEPEDFAATHYEKISLNEKFKAFRSEYQIQFKEYKKVMTDFVDLGIPFHPDRLMEIYQQVTFQHKPGSLLLDYLYTMLPDDEDMTLSHCFNSALIGGVFAKWLKLSEEETKILVLSGFLYDVGKLKLPRELLWKPGKLTDLEFAKIKTHTMTGFNMLKDLDLDQHIIKATLMHHERCDGSGYPSRLRGDKIDRFAKYTAIIDSYEAMTSPRIYRESLNPFQVIENFERSGFLTFEESILKPILSRIANAQVGFKAKLDSGDTGEILVINESKLSRPLLKVNDSIVDLSSKKEIKILAVV